MSDPDNPLNAPVPPAGDDDAEAMGTFTAFELTAHREHAEANHEGAFGTCGEPGCCEAREMLEGMA